MNALDLALRSQELDAEVSATMRRLLPLLDQVEKVCRNFDQLPAEDCVARAEGVAMLADIADRVASESGLQRFADITQAVDGARHEVIQTKRLDAENKASHGRIVETPEPGWLHHGLVLKRAKVVATSRE
jgi:molecular chaperone GrpE (heat shock protein)